MPPFEVGDMEGMNFKKVEGVMGKQAVSDAKTRKGVYKPFRNVKT